MQTSEVKEERTKPCELSATEWKQKEEMCGWTVFTSGKKDSEKTKGKCWTTYFTFCRFEQQLDVQDKEHSFIVILLIFFWLFESFSNEWMKGRRFRKKNVLQELWARKMFEEKDIMILHLPRRVSSKNMSKIKWKISFLFFCVSNFVFDRCLSVLTFRKQEQIILRHFFQFHFEKIMKFRGKKYQEIYAGIVLSIWILVSVHFISNKRAK